MRRRALLLAAVTLAAVPAKAQNQVTVPAQAPRRARATERKPPPLPPIKLPAEPPPPHDPDGPGASTAAPVPNRSLDTTPVVPDARTRLGPGVIDRNLPGKGQANEGSPSLLEDKLFRPVPGARLNVPFSY